VILWCDGAHDVVENMRRDGALLASLEGRLAAASPGGALPEAVLRLFRFAPHGITLGRGQSPGRALDLERCRRDGVAWARRPTGGRAIFHAEEWTYSLAAAIADPEWGGPLAVAYERASSLVLRSLLRLGVPATLASRWPAARGPDRPPPVAAGAACFATTIRHEIVLAGRKLVGSAQRRTARALLQQGSVLLGPGHLRLADYAAVPDAQRADLRQVLQAAAADAGAALGADPPLERWAEALAAELRGGVRRLEAAAGAFLLTPAEAGSYTPPVR
jgi:lipoate-protein ligase A